MKSITFDSSESNFLDRNEEKTLFEFKSNEILQPDDVVGWYERIYGGTDDDHSKIYEIDPLSGDKIVDGRNFIFNASSNAIISTAFINSNDIVSNEQFVFCFDNLQLNSAKIKSKYPENSGNNSESSFSNALIQNDFHIEWNEELVKDQLAWNDSTQITLKKPDSKYEAYIEIQKLNNSKLWNESKLWKDTVRRWGRYHDQKAFEFLNKELTKVGMDVDHFLFDDSVEYANNINQSIRWKFRVSILKRIIKRFGWHKTTHFLFKRLRKIAQTQTFSFRELKLLKRV